MKIALIGFSQIPDGGAVALRQIMMAKGLASLGHKVYLLSPLKFFGGTLTTNKEGVEIIWGRHATKEVADTLIWKILKRYYLFKEARNIFKEGLDWLVIYNMGIDSFFYYFASKIYGFNIAMENNELRIFNGKSLKVILINIVFKFSEMFILKLSNLNIASSTIIENYLYRTAPKIPAIVIFALVDIDKYKYNINKAELFKKKLGIGKEIVISYLGGYHYSRGADILLKACRILEKLGNNYRLVIGGKVFKRKEYIDVPKMVEDLKLKNVIVLKEWLGPEELIEAYSAADILVIPNIDDIEGRAAFPHKLAEYMAMAKAIVASEVGDIPIFLQHGENALLFKPGDPISLAAALAKLLEDADLRRNLSKAAREWCLRHFDCRKIAEQIEQAFTINK